MEVHWKTKIGDGNGHLCVAREQRLAMAMATCALQWNKKLLMAMATRALQGNKDWRWLWPLVRCKGTQIVNGPNHLAYVLVPMSDQSSSRTEDQGTMSSNVAKDCY